VEERKKGKKNLRESSLTFLDWETPATTPKNGRRTREDEKKK